MTVSTADRFGHILEAIANIEALLNSKSFDDVARDPMVRAAFERFLEIISEASRYLPPEIKSTEPDISYRLRHAYPSLNLKTLWNTYASGDLEMLKAATLRLRADIK
jgi:uncharacterized protein with HEPN domain